MKTKTEHAARPKDPWAGAHGPAPIAGSFFIGRVPGDSGQLLIVDPCYVLPEDGTYQEMCKGTYDNSETFALSGAFGTGVKLAGFGGDGHYRVCVTKDDSGRVTRATIDFD